MGWNKEIRNWAVETASILEATDFKSKEVYKYWIDELKITHVQKKT